MRIHVPRALAVAAAAVVLAGTAYAASSDGVYVFSSATRLNDSYRAYNGDLFPCPNVPPKPAAFVVRSNAVSCSSGACVGAGKVWRLDHTADLSPDGSFELSGANAPGAPRFDGRLDGDGAMHVRLIGNFCSYDMVYHRKS